MLLCVWPALNPLSIRVTLTAIVPGAYPWEAKMCLRLIAETDVRSVGDSHPSCIYGKWLSVLREHFLATYIEICWHWPTFVSRTTGTRFTESGFVFGLQSTWHTCSLYLGLDGRRSLGSSSHSLNVKSSLTRNELTASRKWNHFRRTQYEFLKKNRK